jgi:hypothetical protein
MVGIVSSVNLQSILSTIENDPIGAICNFITNNPNAAIDIWNKLYNVLTTGVVDQKFPLSVAYATANSNQLLAGGDSCKSFFNGLQSQFQADLQNDKEKVTDAKQKFIQFIKDHI